MLPPKKIKEGKRKKIFTIDTEHSCDVCEEQIHPVLICMYTLKYSGSECLLSVESCLHHIFSCYRSRARSSLAGGNKIKWRNAEVTLSCVRVLICGVSTAQVHSKSRICVAITTLTSCLEERTTFGGLPFEGTLDKKRNEALYPVRRVPCSARCGRPLLGWRWVLCFRLLRKHF